MKRHLEVFRSILEPKPNNWLPSSNDEEWSGRKEGSYAWYEIQDSTEYWNLFSKSKIIYQEIQFHPRYGLDDKGCFTNNKAFFIPKRDEALLAVLNSPVMWWHNWRFLPHMKDEALTPLGVKMEKLPVADFSDEQTAEIAQIVDQNLSFNKIIAQANVSIQDWLHHEWGFEENSIALTEAHRLDFDGFVKEIRKGLPKTRKLSAVDIARLKQEYSASLEPARSAAINALAAERESSNIVNAAYGLTPEEIALMWSTAPPRMPFQPID